MNMVSQLQLTSKIVNEKSSLEFSLYTRILPLHIVEGLQECLNVILVTWHSYQITGTRESRRLME